MEVICKYLLFRLSGDFLITFDWPAEVDCCVYEKLFCKANIYLDYTIMRIQIGINHTAIPSINMYKCQTSLLHTFIYSYIHSG